MSTSASFVLDHVECLDLAKPASPISTGIGYFDHMLDQFHSHAQVGVAVVVNVADSADNGDNDNDEESFVEANAHKNRNKSCSQTHLMSQVGAALGSKLQLLFQDSNVATGASSRFCCPLDEALVECTLVFCGSSLEQQQNQEQQGRLVEFTLPPYGIYPRTTGRTCIGHMETNAVQPFMAALAQTAGLQLSLRKIRGDNGHHIVESAFKALSRALRNLIDGTNTSNMNTNDENHLGTTLQEDRWWGVDSESYQQGLALVREGTIERQTKETSISVHLQLDGGNSGVSVETGMETLDQFWTTLAYEANFSLNMKCKGDLWVDDHHTSEDVAIAVGQVLNKALGTKAGLNRMWCAQAQLGEARVEVTMDLSNRPCLTDNLTLADSGEEYVGDFLTVEMFHHVLESLVMNGLMTVHIVEQTPGDTVLETAMATAIAFGRALRFCAAVDPRRAGKTASSKGTLSV